MKNLKKITIVLIGALSLAFFNSCSSSEEDEEVRVETSNIPTTYEGRPVNIVPGNIELGSRNVTFNVWDDQTVDGDIITLSVNGVQVISNYTLTGTKKSISVTLNNLGYNHVLLYAHNEGTYSPNTAAVSIVDEDGVENNLTLSSTLLTCQAKNLYVN
jgi:hypothetical protein